MINEAVAIIGMGCHFPQANGLQAYWALLRNGIDAISEVPINRWDAKAFYDPNPATKAKINSRWGGFLEDAPYFDYEFFNITLEEAKRIDPQQKLVLETAWMALEHACIIPAKLSGTSTGVFLGVSHSDHGRKLNNDLMTIDNRVGPHHYHCFVPNRLSYFLNLQGPSIALDTACSSSLAAIHLACQSLRLRESELALAGGVNMHLLPEESIYASLAGYLSSDGRCKSFSEKADGFGRSEGCGIVVLKLAKNAIQDKNPILGIIRGSAVNHNGLSNGITTPSMQSQKALIQTALSNACILPHQISYVEAHGTGTSKGDSFEIGALQSVLKQGRDSAEKCLIGASKANIGHLEAASGVASLIKVILALEHQAIPAQLHLHQLNRYINLEGTPFSIPTQLEPWPIQAGMPRVAAVNALGFGGSNCHMIIEEAPLTKPIDKERSAFCQHLLTLSAKNEQSLRDMVKQYLGFLGAHPSLDLSSLCYTVHTCRTSFDYVASFICDSVPTLTQQLAAYAANDTLPGMVSGKKNKSQQIVFVFGQRVQQEEMFLDELYLYHPYFKLIMDKAFQHIKSRDKHGESLALVFSKNPEISTFIIQYAFAMLLQYWGIVPDGLVAQGIGEIALSCFKGTRTLAECLDFLFSKEPPDPADATYAATLPFEPSNDCIYLEIAGNGFLYPEQLNCEKRFNAGEISEYLLTLLSQAILLDLDINWSHFYKGKHSLITGLPSYPFQKKFCWFGPSEIMEEQNETYT